MLYHCQRLWPYENSSIHPLLPLPISLNVPSHLPWSPSILRKLNEWGWIGLGCTSRNCRAICHNISSCAESIESVFAQFLGGFNALMEHQTLWVSILDIIAVFGVAFGQENAYVYAKSIESCSSERKWHDKATSIAKTGQAKVRIKVFWCCIIAKGSDLMRILRFILSYPEGNARFSNVQQILHWHKKTQDTSKSRATSSSTAR